MASYYFPPFLKWDLRYARRADDMSEKPDSSPTATTEAAPSRRGWRWVLILAFGLAVLGGIWWLSQSIVNEPDAPAKPWDGRPLLVATTYPTMGVPAGAGPVQRFWVSYLNWRMRHGTKHPTNYTFGVSAPTPCSIHGLLNQCMEVTGTRYLIAKEVSAGSVEFGHSNALNGAQWVAAFELALQSNRPSWFDYPSKQMRQENLLLIREKGGVVKVIPPSRLAEYQKAGLVSATVTTPTGLTNSAP